MLSPFYNQKKKPSVIFFLKDANHVIAGLGLASQVLSPNPYLAMNNSYFVHHKEEKCSSLTTEELLSLGEVVAGGRPGYISAVINHSPPTSRAVSPGGQENHH